MKHIILTVAAFASLYMASDAFYIVRGAMPSSPGQQVLLGSGAGSGQFDGRGHNQPTMIIIGPSSMSSGFNAMPPSSAPLPAPAAPAARAATPMAIPVAAVNTARPARTVTSGSPPPPRASVTRETSHHNDFYNYMLADKMDYPMALLASRHGGLFGGKDMFSRYLMMDAMDLPFMF